MLYFPPQVLLVFCYFCSDTVNTPAATDPLTSSVEEEKVNERFATEFYILYADCKYIFRILFYCQHSVIDDSPAWYILPHRKNNQLPGVSQGPRDFFTKPLKTPALTRVPVITHWLCSSDGITSISVHL